MKQKPRDVAQGTKKQPGRINERTVEKPVVAPEKKKLVAKKDQQNSAKLRIIAALGKLHPMD